MNTRVSIVLIASALFAGVAGAQSTQAVEWKVSEGGNGHWYEVRSSGLPPFDARNWQALHEWAAQHAAEAR